MSIGRSKSSRFYACDVYRSNALFIFAYYRSHVGAAILFVVATQCLCCCYATQCLCQSLTCVRRHFEFITATQCLCCCYVVYLSHVGAAILNVSQQRSVYVVAKYEYAYQFIHSAPVLLFYFFCRLYMSGALRVGHV